MRSRKIREFLKAGGVCTAFIALVGTAADAREPGVPPSVPPGNTTGVPIGANPPPGFYLNSLNGYSSLELKDANGDDVGLDVDIADTAVQLLWVPGFKLLGGDYRAFILQPLLHVDQNSSIGAIPSGTEFALGNTHISPLGVSWAVAPGQFVSADLGFIAPTGKWNASDPVNTAGNFWTFAPSLGYSYLNNGWNASVHLQYFANTENKTNDYKSGDEVLVNVTALKNVGDFSIGPVAYYRKQLSSDRNDGTAFGGTTAGKSEQFAIGLGLTTNIGKTAMNMRLTHDIKAENTLGGTSLKVDFSVPLGRK